MQILKVSFVHANYSITVDGKLDNLSAQTILLFVHRGRKIMYMDVIYPSTQVEINTNRSTVYECCPARLLQHASKLARTNNSGNVQLWSLLCVLVLVVLTSLP